MGGLTLSDNRIAFARPSIDEAEIEAVTKVLKSGWLTAGPECDAFETEAAALLAAPASVAVSSCSAGLHLALLAAGIGPGDEVIVPAITFVSTAHAVRHVGAAPVFCDVDPIHFNMAPDSVAKLVSDRTRAIIAVHYAGVSCDLDALRAIAKQRGLVLIGDAAHAFGSSHGDGPIGASADLTVFSLYSTKLITSAEGGLVVGSNDLLDRIRVLRNNGLSRAAHQRDVLGRYDVATVGFKYTLPDVLAAIGRAQLQKLDGYLARRQAIAAQYSQILADEPDLILPLEAPGRVWWLYTIRFAPTVSRDEVQRRLAEEGVGTSVLFPLVPHLSAYREWLRDEDIPVSIAVAGSILSLPLHPSLSDEDVRRAASTLKRVIAEEVASRG